MIQSIIEYTGFFVTAIFVLGIVASILFAIWDEVQSTKFPILHFLKRKPGNLIRLLKNPNDFNQLKLKLEHILKINFVWLRKKNFSS